MKTAIALDVDDLVRPRLTGNHNGSAWQCQLLDSYTPPVVSAFVSADDARRISASWSALAEELDRRDREALELLAAHEATLDRAFGETPAPWPVSVYDDVAPAGGYRRPVLDPETVG